jgi:hypothetical protein
MAGMPQIFGALGAQVDFIDLRETKASPVRRRRGLHPQVMETRASRFAGILVAAPVYNFYMNAAEDLVD